MRRSIPVVWWMVLAIAVVTALAYWDEERESGAALDDFAEEQAKLAQAVSIALSAHLASSDLDVLADAKRIESGSAIRILVKRPMQPGLTTTDGAPLRSSVLETALAEKSAWARLSREEAAAVGLPARMAMAGLSTIDLPPLGTWGIAVVASAQRERDRERRAERRLILGVVVASGLVFAFGGFALRKQRKELELERELAVAAVEKGLDERLVRADKLATMGALATGIAHEVSTPLGVIMGRAEQLLPKLEGDEKSRRAVEAICEQSERISGIIRGFLRLARGGSPTLEQAEPAALVRTSLGLVEHRFVGAGITLTSDVAPDLPRVSCEPRLFEQVLVNLLLNACDACERGGVVELTASASGERVAFAVTDDGAGISEETAARATEPFFTTKGEGKGTGLGLAIASEIVKHHSGVLTIAPRSASGTKRGTRACAELPAVHEAPHA
ncbi:MAG: ATP-binding protein [Polyangiaceae bacterium]